jgi:5-methylcytosine-specific restriction endonuclease McrA
MKRTYATSLWRETARAARQRDGSRCTYSRLLGGECRGTLHVHHIVRPEDGGARYDLDNLGTVCAAHHPRWEALRRELARRRAPDPPRCPHTHRTREARRLCEARLARRRVAV